MSTLPLRNEMIAYALRLLALSGGVTLVAAWVLFLGVRRVILKPIKGVVDGMKSYAEAPEDARRVIRPSATVVELHQAEEALATMQTQLTGALRQKDRLAQLGGAMAKVNHDLRTS